MLQALLDTVQRFKEKNYFEVKYIYVVRNDYIKIATQHIADVNLFNLNGFELNNLMVINIENAYSSIMEGFAIFDNGDNLRKAVEILTHDEFAIKSIIE